jgi:hypothetical protein
MEEYWLSHPDRTFVAQEGVYLARERQVRALWRLGWNDRAKLEQGRLDQERGWWCAKS